jgi:hypothetical protein
VSYSDRDASRLTTCVLSELFARKLLGRTDIEDALKRLDRLIQEEFQMVTAQILKVATEGKDGTRLSTSYQRHTKCPST